MIFPVRTNFFLKNVLRCASHYTGSADLTASFHKLSFCQRYCPEYKVQSSCSGNSFKKTDGGKLRQRLISFETKCIHTTVNQEKFDSDLSCIQCSGDDVQEIMMKDMIIIPDFVTAEEEQSILDEVEPYLKRLRYESSHWDDAIHSYRETERKHWRETNKSIIQRIRDTAFPKHVPQLSLVHVLDLSKEGFIKPHVDAVRFCGNTIAGLSLLSSAVMRLIHTENSEKQADILLKQRSLYIMKDDARYKYTHEVLKNEDSVFKGQPIQRDRRIAVICRNEPT